MKTKLQSLYVLILRIRFLCVLLASFLFQAQAKTSTTDNTVLDKTVTIEWVDVPLKDALNQLAQKAACKFVYSEDLFPSDKHISMKANGQRLRDILDHLLKPYPVYFTSDQEYIYIKQRSKPISNVQEKAINGTVTDFSSGEAMAGVNVFIEGTTSGTTTDINGKYSLVITQENVVLVFSFIGYDTKKIPLTNQATIDVAMTPSIQTLEDVVIIGYGKEEKINLTGSVAVIKGEQLNARPITQTSQALYGLVPGVYLNAKTSEPGNDQPDIRIRGIGTLNNANPLILVDGIEAPMNNINPGDIASITVLKDAASASIYGSRASNGVILITTKRGNLDQNITVNYDVYTGFARATVLPKMLLDNKLYLQLYKEAQQNIGGTVKYTEADIERYGNMPSVDWMKEVFRDAKVSQHSLSLQGGTKQVSFLYSLSYLDQNSILNGNQNFKRLNNRLNLDARISDKVSIGSSLSYVRGDGSLATKQSNFTDASGYGNTDFLLAITQPPFGPVYDNLGRYAGPEVGLGLQYLGNARATLDNNSNKDIQDAFLGSLFAEYEPLKNLKIKGTVALNNQTESYTSIKKAHNVYDVVTGSKIQALSEFTYEKNELIESFNTTSNITSWLQATYEHSFGGHHLKLLAGFNQETSKSKSIRIDQNTFASPELIVLGIGSVTATTPTRQGEWALRSYFGRLAYNYNEKYLLEVTGRRDGSSRFGANNRWAMFPAVSAGWIVSNENFWKTNISDYLKIRGSWGILGNQNTDLYPFASLFTLDKSYIINGAIASGGAISTLGNPDLKWEETTTSDVGIEAGFLNSKITLEADYFIRKTSDILTKLNNPLIAGIPNPTIVNAASMENKGWEATLNYQDQFGDLKWKIGGNITHVKNRVTAINPDLTGSSDHVYGEVRNNVNLIRGEQINTIFGYVTEGIYQTQEEVSNGPTESIFGVAKPGDFKIQDKDGDKKITAADRQVIGNRLPEWLYGFNFDLRYKGFDFSSIFQGIGKADIYMTRYTGPFPKAGLLEEWVNRWTPENPSTTMPRLWFDRAGYNGKTVQELPGSYWVKNRQYFRLKNIQLGYTLPRALLKKTFISSLRLFVNGQNLWTITKLNNFDPERNDSETYVTTSLPQTKTYTIGLNAKF